MGKIQKAVMVLALALATLVPSRAYADRDDVKVVPRDALVSGKTYGDWAAQWQQWALALPAAHHPLFDTAPCGTGQSGPVWFLGGFFAGALEGPRPCTVPRGKYLFFPVVNWELSVPESGGVEDLAGMRAWVAGQIDLAQNLSATIDGVRVRNLEERFRVQAPAFSFTLPEGDILTALGVPGLAKGSYFPAVDDGVYLMLEPLAPGQHIIHFHAEMPQFEPTFVIDVRYAVTVE